MHNRADNWGYLVYRIVDDDATKFAGLYQSQQQTEAGALYSYLDCDGMMSRSP